MLPCYRSLALVFLFTSAALQAQNYWQQHVDYKMDIEFNVKKHQFDGAQTLVYTNNSPDTLTRLFYHLYFNAFQPGSEMDVRNKTIADPHPQVRDRISKLSKSEQGYLKPKNLKINGRDIDFVVQGTILEVRLSQPILPGAKTELKMEFEGQVPLQIRRSGRENSEGIDYSMSQWYPKLCEYDTKGWHPNPYVGREFYGIWGDFDVKITIDKDFVLGAGGVLQNPKEVGKGYENGDASLIDPDKKKLTWHFVAKNVHDFVWAADPDYVVKQLKADNGTNMFFVYQPGEKTTTWEDFPKIMARVFALAEARYGKYPYPVYSFIQGGDGGMEYPMATLITGNRPLNSLVGVSVHELMHSWYQGMLATDEARFSWMDEGFTSYASEIIMNELRREKRMPGNAVPNPMLDDVNGYINYALSGGEEPLSTHADHFETNQAYGISSYTKGSVTLVELAYIMGQPALDRTMLRYYDKWSFKHPTDDDFFRVAEQESGLVLDWFIGYWVNSTHSMDYGISNVEKDGKRTAVTLTRKSVFPMPLDVLVTYADGSEEMFYIPLDVMRGEKPAENEIERTVLADWAWVNKTYELEIPAKLKKIKKIEIDPSLRMADTNRTDNKWEATEDKN